MTKSFKNNQKKKREPVIVPENNGKATLIERMCQTVQIK